MVIRQTSLGVVLLLAACKPEVEGRPSLVDGDRVLAVMSEPAEAKPKAAVRYTALYVNPDGALDATALEFAFCNERKPLALSGPVAPACLQSSAKGLAPIEPAEDQSIAAALPDDACRVFGPTAPAKKENEAAARPADPDPTGGYYQPVRVLASIEGEAEPTVGVTRLDCGLAGATQDQAASYAKQHKPNQNPAIASLVIVRARGREEELTATEDAEPVTVKPGAELSLRASWNACPSTPECGDGICSPGEDRDNCADDCPNAQAPGCSGAEPYLALDPVSHELKKRHEAIRTSWFATDGRFDHERTGRSESEANQSDSDNVWTAPNSHGEVRFWLVIRDDRGGVGWAAYRLNVQP